MGLIEAVRQLRAALGLSQQAFATRLGLAIRSVAYYEQGRKPDNRALARMAKAADEIGRDELANHFWRELEGNLGIHAISRIGDLKALVILAQRQLGDLQDSSLTVERAHEIGRELSATLTRLSREFRDFDPRSYSGPVRPIDPDIALMLDPAASAKPQQDRPGR